LGAVQRVSGNAGAPLRIVWWPVVTVVGARGFGGTMIDSSGDGMRGDVVSAALRRISDDLASRFTGQFPREAVERCVDESYQSLDQTARIKQFLPVFTRRLAVERLAALAENGSDHRDRH
jgi:hypothetical protein